MVFGSAADVVPNGTATAVTTDKNLQASTITLTATGSSCRYGDANVGSGRGAKLPAGIPVVLPVPEFEQGLYPLANLYLYASGTDSISISWA